MDLLAPLVQCSTVAAVRGVEKTHKCNAIAESLPDDQYKRATNALDHWRRSRSKRWNQTSLRQSSAECPIQLRMSRVRLLAGRAYFQNRWFSDTERPSD